MGRYRSKVVEIEAVRSSEAMLENDGSGGAGEWPQWLQDACDEGVVNVDGTDGVFAEIETMEGTMVCNIGDWIIRGLEGELYPCKDSVFQAKYEPLEA